MVLWGSDPMHPQQQKAKENTYKHKVIGKVDSRTPHPHCHGNSIDKSTAQQPISPWQMGNSALMSATQIKHTYSQKALLRGTLLAPTGEE